MMPISMQTDKKSTKTRNDIITKLFFGIHHFNRLIKLLKWRQLGVLYFFYATLSDDSTSVWESGGIAYDVGSFLCGKV